MLTHISHQKTRPLAFFASQHSSETALRASELPLTQLPNNTRSSKTSHSHSLSHRLDRSRTVTHREHPRHTSFVERRTSNNIVLRIDFKPKLRGKRSVQLRGWRSSLLRKRCQIAWNTCRWSDDFYSLTMNASILVSPSSRRMMISGWSRSLRCNDAILRGSRVTRLPFAAALIASVTFASPLE